MRKPKARDSFAVGHLLMLAAAGFYLQTGQYQTGTIYAITAIIMAVYHIAATQLSVEKRIRQHLSVIEEAANDSSEFQKGISQKNKEEDDNE